VIDIEKSLLEDLFVPDLFVDKVWEEAQRAYALSPRSGVFHSQDLFEVLREEPRSLYCFVNFQFIPAEHLRLIRCFTQSHHRVLLLCRGTRDLLWEERTLREQLADDDDSLCGDVFYGGP
jgi:hypothetical protein